MNSRDQQIADELRNISVTKDAYELWLQNDVTRMFLLEAEKEFLSTAIQPCTLGSIEQIAISEIKRSSECSIWEQVLDWSPDFGQDE